MSARIHRHHLSRSERAFTLLELLVTIATIGLLMGLVIPGLGSARTAAKATVCISNLRQWGTATNMYAMDNGGYLPRRGQGAQPTVFIDRPDDWFNALPPYLELPPYSELVASNRRPQPGESSVWIC